jgi:hypothetical protein
MKMIFITIIYVILDSKRSDECIDFKMICFFFIIIFFFLSVITFWSSNNVSICDFSLSLKRKIHQKFPIIFKSVGKNPEKITEKREFLRIITF